MAYFGKFHRKEFKGHDAMIAITGGSGQLATQVAKCLLDSRESIRVYGRSVNVNLELANVYEQVLDYSKISFPKEVNALVITNGFFVFKNFEEMSLSEIEEQITANFSVVTKLIWSFLKNSQFEKRRDVFVIGSTAAYDLGEGASIYGASKLALKGLLAALGKEYSKIDTRFSFISFSTINNSMGKLVLDQDPTTLLELDEVAKEIAGRVLRRKNYFEPEVILRRRFIQEHKQK